MHLSVGLTNFSFGMPKEIRESVESAYLTLAVEAASTSCSATRRRTCTCSTADDKFVRGIADALEAGRPTDGETQEEAGFRQAAKIIEMFDRHHDH